MAASIGNISPDAFNQNILTEPTVIKGITKSWPCSSWEIEDLSELLGDDKIRFRLGLKNVGDSGVEFEGDCIYQEATMRDFCEWCRKKSTEEDLLLTASSVSPSMPLHSANITNQDVLQHSEDKEHLTKEESLNPLLLYERTHHWCYADYKRMVHIFKDHPSVLEDVRWKDLGFSDHDGHQSTIWIGSEGANTPCHQDTYGFNLVAQIRGRKKWHLFPPSQTELMYPTRLPYEESSVFSRVNVRSPDLERHPKFGRATPYVVVLHPGDILFVPKLWWHFVESLDTSISINCWMDLESDHVSRVDEAIARTLVCGLMLSEGRVGDGDERESLASWLNPTEEATSKSTNLAVLRVAVDAVLTHCSKASQGREGNSEVNVSENMPEAYKDLKEGYSTLRRCRHRTRDTSEDQVQGIVDSKVKRLGGTCVDVGERAALVEEMDSGNTKGAAHPKQRSHSYCLDSRSTSPINEYPIHVGSPTLGLAATSDSSWVEPAGWQERKREIEGTDQGQPQSDSAKQIKLCDNVTMPGSGMKVARQSVFCVPCHGFVTQLTASHTGNDCANLKIEQETGIPSGSALETSDSFVDVTMATLVECLTQPKIIASLREGLLETIRGKHCARTLDD